MAISLPESFPQMSVSAFAPIDSRMYVLIPQGIKSPEVLVVDPQQNEMAIARVEAVSPRKVYIVLTHEHYDHISGVNVFRERFQDRCCVICTTACAERITDASKNLSRYFESLFCGHSEEIRAMISALNVRSYTCYADFSFDQEYTLQWDGPSLYFRATPGHSPGSMCIIMGEKVCFSGDTLLRTETILRLPGSNRKVYMEKTQPWLRQIKEGTIICPGHSEFFVHIPNENV